MADLKDFAEKLVNLTVKEVNELAGILKEEYGIEPAAAAVAVAAGGAAAGGDAAEEKSRLTGIVAREIGTHYWKSPKSLYNDQRPAAYL